MKLSMERRYFLQPSLFQIQLSEPFTPLPLNQYNLDIFCRELRSLKPWLCTSSMSSSQHTSKARGERWSSSVIPLNTESNSSVLLYHFTHPCSAPGLLISHSNRPLTLNQNYSLFIALPLLYNTSRLKPYRARAIVPQNCAKTAETHNLS